MWSSRLLRNAALGLALVAPLLLGGCSGFRPVYGDGGLIAQRLEFNYAKPGSRTDQIIIQELALRLGSGSNPDAPEIRISSAAGARGLTRTNVTKPGSHLEMSVRTSYSVVTADGETLVSGTREASAAYVTSGQVIADEAAAKDATERAAREVAETIRLSILAQLAAPVREAARIQ